MATLAPPQYESLRKYSSEQSILSTGDVKYDPMRGSLPLTSNQNAPLDEIRVFTSDKKFIMVPLELGSNSTADTLLELCLSYLNIEQELGKDVFALWAVSSNLELQLKPTHKPVRLLLQWQGLLNSYTDLTISETVLEVPTLVLRRSSYLQLKLERSINNNSALYLLFSEAKYNFLNSRYTFCEMREIQKLGAYLVLSEGTSQSDFSLEWLIHKDRINEYQPIKSLGKRSGLDVSTKNKKIIVCKQLFSSIQIQQAKGQNSNTFRTLFLQSCQNLAIYGAVFFNGVVERPISFLAKLTQSSSDRHIFVALNAITLHIIDYATNEVLFKLYYDHFSWLYQPPSRSGGEEFCSLWIEFDSVLENSLVVSKQLQIFSKQSSLMDSLIQHHVTKLSHRPTQIENPNRPQPISALTISQPIITPHIGEGHFTLLSFSVDGEEIPKSKIRRGMTTFKKSVTS
ncbi:FERM domain-containing protein 8 [Oopsacas minuta]|uniref:FERM domain-containing protein 8 n=1 Tax=Oopsacas minuta TaxID=111878 RepID=A0AAV7K8Z8_9METZ|nr:FERM domain-containing protein 8 [Oopsacas minuta]